MELRRQRRGRRSAREASPRRASPPRRPIRPGSVARCARAQRRCPSATGFASTSRPITPTARWATGAAAPSYEPRRRACARASPRRCSPSLRFRAPLRRRQPLYLRTLPPAAPRARLRRRPRLPAAALPVRHLPGARLMRCASRGQFLLGVALLVAPSGCRRNPLPASCFTLEAPEQPVGFDAPIAIAVRLRDRRSARLRRATTGAGRLASGAAARRCVRSASTDGGFRLTARMPAADRGRPHAPALGRRSHLTAHPGRDRRRGDLARRRRPDAHAQRARGRCAPVRAVFPTRRSAPVSTWAGRVGRCAPSPSAARRRWPPTVPPPACYPTSRVTGSSPTAPAECWRYEPNATIGRPSTVAGRTATPQSRPPP